MKILGLQTLLNKLLSDEKNYYILYILPIWISQWKIIVYCTFLENSLVVQLLGLRASTAGGTVWFLVRKLRSCMLHGMDRKKYIHTYIYIYVYIYIYIYIYVYTHTFLYTNTFFLKLKSQRWSYLFDHIFYQITF